MADMAGEGSTPSWAAIDRDAVHFSWGLVVLGTDSGGTEPSSNPRDAGRCGAASIAPKDRSVGDAGRCPSFLGWTIRRSRRRRSQRGRRSPAPAPRPAPHTRPPRTQRRGMRIGGWVGLSRGSSTPNLNPASAAPCASPHSSAASLGPEPPQRRRRLRVPSLLREPQRRPAVHHRPPHVRPEPPQRLDRRHVPAQCRIMQGSPSIL